MPDLEASGLLSARCRPDLSQLLSKRYSHGRCGRLRHFGDALSHQARNHQQAPALRSVHLTWAPDKCPGLRSPPTFIDLCSRPYGQAPPHA